MICHAFVNKVLRRTMEELAGVVRGFGASLISFPGVLSYLACLTNI